MHLDPTVIDILERSATEGNKVILPPGQLDRATYIAVDKALQAAGGRWNRSAKAHLFPDDAASLIDVMLTTGMVTTAQEMGYFPTPAAVVAQLIESADPYAWMQAFEPSAGEGAIAGPLAGRVRAVDCVEIDPRRAAVIERAGYARDVRVADFLTLIPAPVYDLVVMNPPFARQQDIDHVAHALAFLKPEGRSRVVSVMAAGVMFRQNRKADEFRKLVANHGGDIIPIPDDAFRVSGTGVRTVIAVIPA